MRVKSSASRGRQNVTAANGFLYFFDNRKISGLALRERGAGPPAPRQKSSRLEIWICEKSSRLDFWIGPAGFDATGFLFRRPGWAGSRLDFLFAGQGLAGNATGFFIRMALAWG